MELMIISTYGNLSVLYMHQIINIMRNNSYLFCILTGICQRIFEEFTNTDYGFEPKSVIMPLQDILFSPDLGSQFMTSSCRTGENETAGEMRADF